MRKRTVTISRNGAVVIPADLRKKYKLHAGVQVSVVDYGDETGMLKGRTSLTRALIAEHRRER